MELYYGVVYRDYLMESYYGIVLRNHITGLHYRIIMGVYYGRILWNHITEFPCQKEPGQPLDVPRAPWNAWDPPGRHQDPWGTTGDPTATKTTIPQQIYSARSSRLLHPNLFVATHHPSEPRDVPDRPVTRLGCA